MLQPQEKLSALLHEGNELTVANVVAEVRLAFPQLPSDMSDDVVLEKVFELLQVEPADDASRQKAALLRDAVERGLSAATQDSESESPSPWDFLGEPSVRDNNVLDAGATPEPASDPVKGPELKAEDQAETLDAALNKQIARLGTPDRLSDLVAIFKGIIPPISFIRTHIDGKTSTNYSTSEIANILENARMHPERIDLEALIPNIEIPLPSPMGLRDLFRSIYEKIEKNADSIVWTELSGVDSLDSLALWIKNNLGSTKQIIMRRKGNSEKEYTTRGRLAQVIRDEMVSQLIRWSDVADEQGYHGELSASDLTLPSALENLVSSVRADADIDLLQLPTLRNLSTSIDKIAIAIRKLGLVEAGVLGAADFGKLANSADALGNVIALTEDVRGEIVVNLSTANETELRENINIITRKNGLRKRVIQLLVSNNKIALQIQGKRQGFFKGSTIENTQDLSMILDYFKIKK